MKLINLIPKTTELLASPDNAGIIKIDNESLGLNTDGQLSLQYQPDNNTIVLNEKKYEVKLSSTGGLKQDGQGIAVDWTQNNSTINFVSLDNEWPLVFNSLNVVNIAETNQVYTIKLPKAENCISGQELEIFINDNYNSTTFNSYRVIFEADKDIKIAGDISESNGKTVIANTAQALVGFKIIKDGTNSYWIASGNCGKNPIKGVEVSENNA